MITTPVSNPPWFETNGNSSEVPHAAKSTSSRVSALGCANRETSPVEDIGSENPRGAKPADTLARAREMRPLSVSKRNGMWQSSTWLGSCDRTS